MSKSDSANPNYVDLNIAGASALCVAVWRARRAHAAKVAPLLIGAPGTGKCLGKGTPVMLASGKVVPVESIKAGDKLMGPDSKPRTVLSTTVGEGPLFRIEPKKGEPWVCNDVHVLTLVESETGKVIDIALNELLPLPKYRREKLKQFHVAVDFHSEPLPERAVSPYFLGVWLGDGAKSLRDNVLAEVSVTKWDAEIREACEREARRFGCVVRVEAAHDRCPEYRIVTGTQNGGQPNPLLDAMRELMTGGIKVPEHYLRASRFERLELLAGLIDTDGHLDSNTFEVTQKNKNIADGIVFLARSLGFQATSRLKLVEGYGAYHRVFISGDIVQIPTRIFRKRAAPRRQVKDVTRTGFDVVPLGQGQFFGFMLDNDGRFLLGDCTVTHNTELGKILARATQRTFGPLEMQGLADEDLNGVPTRDPATGMVIRLPIGPVRAAHVAGTVFMLDEIDRSGAQKQGALLAGLRERRFGDTYLHPETDLLLAANGSSSGGTHNLISAFLNRCLPVNFVQDAEEVQGYLAGGWRKAEAPDPISLDVPGWTADKLNEALADLMLDFSATSAKAPGLIQTEAPAGSEENGAPWASGRAIVEGLKCFNVGLASGLTGDVLFALLAGCIGKEAAGSFFAVRKVRDRLPSWEEISTKPQTAKVPDAADVEANVGVLGLAAIAASKNANNAWLYAARLQNRECGVALTRGLLKFPPTSPEALKVKMTMMGRVGLANEA